MIVIINQVFNRAVNGGGGLAWVYFYLLVVSDQWISSRNRERRRHWCCGQSTHAQKEIIQIITWCFNPTLRFPDICAAFFSSAAVRRRPSRKQEDENMSIRQQSDQMLVESQLRWRVACFTWGRLENSAVDDELNMLRCFSSWTSIHWYSITLS